MSNVTFCQDSWVCWARTPFGGVKASGLGHEGGYRSLDFYTDQQAVHVTLGPVHTPRFGAGPR